MSARSLPWHSATRFAAGTAKYGTVDTGFVIRRGLTRVTKGRKVMEEA